jgi:hypothetical protein
MLPIPEINVKESSLTDLLEQNFPAQNGEKD